MKLLSRNKYKATLLLMGFFFSLSKVNATHDSLKIELLLNKKIYNSYNFFDKPIECIDITKSGLISIASSNQLYVVGWGGIKAIGQKSQGSISSFAIAPEGVLLAIKNNELCHLDTLGHITKLFNVPNQDMRIHSGKHVVYLFDHLKNKQKYAMYYITADGKYAKLFDVSNPINSIAEGEKELFFTNQNAIIKYDFKNKSFKPVIVLENKKEIRSLTFDSTNNRIFFSTNDAIYSVKDSTYNLVTDKFGGIIKYYIDGLIIFKPEEQSVIRIVGLNLNSTQKQDITTNKVKETLTNASIIKMAQAKLADDLIIDVIKTSDVDFDLSVEAMVNLSNKGVSSAVIKEMKSAMEQKNK